MFTNTKLLLSADAACSVLLTVFLLPLVLLASFFGRPHLDATPSMRRCGLSGPIRFGLVSFRFEFTAPAAW